MKTSHAVVAVLAGMTAALAIGFFIGCKWAGAAVASVTVAAAGARHQVTKTKKQAEVFASKVSAAIKESEEEESDLEITSVKVYSDEEWKTRDGLDFGESAWERKRIFPDS